MQRKFARSCLVVCLAALSAVACGHERPTAGTGGPGGGVGAGSASADAGVTSDGAGESDCVSTHVRHALDFVGRRPPGAACCPGSSPADCQPYACVCADGSAFGCTFGCRQTCTNGTCIGTTCDDPMTMCTGNRDLCAGRGGVTGVRAAFSYDDCEGPGGANDAGPTDAGPADAATDAPVIFPPAK